MKSITKIKEIEKIIRQILSSQSDLDIEYVRNALSLYGTELDELLEQNVYQAIDQKDAVLLFELLSRPSNNSVSMSESVSEITYYKAFRLKIIIYGNDSSDIALKLCGRFRTEEIRTNLYEQGIYLEKVNDPDIVNEYKNETMWLRNDIDLDIAIKYTITPSYSDPEFSSLTELNIIKKEEV